MLLPPPLNVPGVLIYDRVFDATHRLSIAQDDWIGGGSVVIRVSNDGGATWVELDDFTMLNSNAYVMPAWDGADTYVILCDEEAGSDWMFRSTDGGDSWARVTSLSGPSLWNITQPALSFAYGLNAWWHMRLDTGFDYNLYKSTDNCTTWTAFWTKSTEIDWLIHPVYGVVGWDIDTAAGGTGIWSSSDGVSAMSLVAGWGALPFARIDNRDHMFCDGNSNLFGFFNNTGLFPYYNDNPADLSSWRRASVVRPDSDQSGSLAFSASGSGKWMWDGSKTTRRGNNSNFTAGPSQSVFWWTKDGTVWSASPLNRTDDASNNGRYGSKLENYMVAMD